MDREGGASYSPDSDDSAQETSSSQNEPKRQKEWKLARMLKSLVGRGGGRSQQKPERRLLHSASTPEDTGDKELDHDAMVEKNIKTLLDQFSHIDPTHVPSGKRGGQLGIRGGDSFKHDGVFESSTRIIYNTVTGEITALPKGFEKDMPEGADLEDYPYKARDYSCLDTWMRPEGPYDRPYPETRYMIRLHLPPGRIQMREYGHQVKTHIAGQKATEHQDAEFLASVEGDLDTARQEKAQAADAFAELEEIDRKHAELYSHGDIILPRRLAPSEPYDSALLAYEPWGQTDRATFPGVDEDLIRQLDPKGDLIIRDTINTFNSRYGPEWLQTFHQVEQSMKEPLE